MHLSRLLSPSDMDMLQGGGQECTEEDRKSMRNVMMQYSATVKRRR
jgi:hypothetical protein